MAPAVVSFVLTSLIAGCIPVVTNAEDACPVPVEGPKICLTKPSCLGFKCAEDKYLNAAANPATADAAGCCIPKTCANSFACAADQMPVLPEPDTPTKEACCKDRTGFCLGNKVTADDYTCTDKKVYMDDATAKATLKVTDAACQNLCGLKCTSDTTCDGGDATLNTNKYHSYTGAAGDAKAECCDKINCCKTKCGADKVLKPNPEGTDRGTTAQEQDKCCMAKPDVPEVPDVTGKCGGNTKSADDVTCGATQNNKGASTEKLAAEKSEAEQKAHCCTDRVKHCTNNKEAAQNVACGKCITDLQETGSC